MILYWSIRVVVSICQIHPYEILICERTASALKLQLPPPKRRTFAQNCRDSTLESPSAVETILDRPFRLEQVSQLGRRYAEPQLRDQRIDARLQLARNEPEPLDRKQKQRLQSPA